MRPTGKLHLGHLVGALRNWVVAAGHLRLPLLRRRLARADQPLQRHQRDRRQRARQHGRLDRRGHRPRALDAVRPVAGAGARRAGAPARHDHADPVAGARADLQGTDGPARRARSLVDRLPRLSAAADGRRHHLQRALRAGGRRSGAASRALARDRPAVPQLLRRGVRRAAAAAHGRAAAARPRQPQDEQELRQHHRPDGRCGDGEEEGPADVHGPEARARRHPGHGRGQSGVHLPRRVQPERRGGGRPEGSATAPARSATSRSRRSSRRRSTPCSSRCASGGPPCSPGRDTSATCCSRAPRARRSRRARRWTACATR